jgi:hypothetical protein
MPQTINHPYHFHLEAYTHLINFAESDPAARDFIGSLLNENLQNEPNNRATRSKMKSNAIEFN